MVRVARCIGNRTVPWSIIVDAVQNIPPEYDFGRFMLRESICFITNRLVEGVRWEIYRRKRVGIP
jgi:hypothetical protein